MIVSRIVGGLGNQLFQYAIARHLAKINNTKLKLDISGYKNNIADAQLGIRTFNLAPFNIQAEIATDTDLEKFNFHNNIFFRKLMRLYSRRDSYFNRSYILEPAKNYFRFDKKILEVNVNKDIYLEGYWQSPKYFESITNTIKNDFSFKEEPNGLNKQMLTDIQNQESISIHIRHGDNANKVAKKHGVLTLDYYNEAIKILTADIKNPIFYIFSDDPDWAKENLKLKYPSIYISHNGDEKNYEDLRLMSNCKHHIVGNSTFSWWGAWLGKKDKQKVFAPKYYHVNVDISNSDFYPNNWKII